MSTYRITTSDGRRWTTDYATQEKAIAAVARVYGWADPVISEPYAVRDDEDGDILLTAVSVYETEEDCADDQDGSHAPRITTA